MPDASRNRQPEHPHHGSLTFGSVDFLSRVAGVAAAFLIALAVVVVCDMVFVRYVFNLHHHLADRLRHLQLVAATFIGAPTC